MSDIKLNLHGPNRYFFEENSLSIDQRDRIGKLTQIINSHYCFPGCGRVDFIFEIDTKNYPNLHKNFDAVNELIQNCLVDVPESSPPQNLNGSSAYPSPREFSDRFWTSNISGQQNRKIYTDFPTRSDDELNRIW